MFKSVRRNFFFQKSLFSRIKMFSGPTYARTLSNITLKNVTSYTRFVGQWRNIHRSAVSLNSSSSNSSDGFLVENMDSESKEKLLSLKSMLLKNSYYEKYKDKIVKAQRSYPTEFLSLLESLRSSKTKSVTSDYVPTMSSQTKKRKLEEVMKVELLSELERNDISFIWQEYHHKKGQIAACMQCSVFERIQNNATFCNTFVLPLIRKSGHDFHVVQFSNNSFYFTPLISWQTYKENAPVTLTLTYFEELEDKDIILMRGEFDKNTINQLEALELAVQIHLYYAEPDMTRSTLMEKFVSSPMEFEHTDLIVELQRMKENYKKLFGNEDESTESQ